METYLVSACLTGLKTRYDGRIVPSPACRIAVAGGIVIPFCPEQLGGLATPRPAADLVGGDGHAVLAGRARVVTRGGIDVTPQFIEGARQSLQIARQQEVARVLLKARSPSCGLGPVVGVTAALLLEEGFAVTELE
jgi:uncharacterized protein YbbK (DUF523 family)